MVHEGYFLPVILIAQDWQAREQSSSSLSHDLFISQQSMYCLLC